MEKNESSVGAFIGFVVLILIGGIAFYFIFFTTYMKVQQAKSWREVSCEIVSSKVRIHAASSQGTSRTGTTYSIDIKYKYEIDGHNHESDRYDFMSGGSDSTFKNKKKIVANYKKGSISKLEYDETGQLLKTVSVQDFHSYLYNGVPTPASKREIVSEHKNSYDKFNRLITVTITITKAITKNDETDETTEQQIIEYTYK